MQLQRSEGAPLLFAGDVFCDVVFSGVAVPEAGTEVFADAFTVTPGGVANRAVASARLGVPTILLAQFGDDVLGMHIRSLLADEPNLDVSRTRVVPGHQSPVTVSLTGAHDRSFITYEEKIDDLGLPADLAPVAATHIGVSATLPDWVRTLRAAGTTIVGGVGWDSSGEWHSDVLDSLCDVDVFVPNDLEAMNYTRTDDPVAAARALGERVELAVVTRGSRGAVAFDSGTGELTEVPAVLVPAVDPTGAGDVFVATFMAVLETGWPMEERLRFAGLCASLSVMSLGGAASAPRPDDLLRHIDEFSPEGDWSFVDDWATSHAPAVPATPTPEEI
ncbi:carbohydrate kinase family protein [Frondihabitans australicus]|uniref:Sugar/nucleoside kinase (Ribokinase family) n=1 Tax=Frondihabitans australicus TaxID=386892 RepID=A0A495IHT5_9MICO|nr:PfkB family carbohydrate kinase [Frondihabitans australicus]RKR75270.1 sugar/nucleoside kinase (ribokinase family) [Frondihabitans australicus]